MEPQLQKIVDKILDEARENAKHLIGEAREYEETLMKQQREQGRQKAQEEILAVLQKAENKVDIAAITETIEANRKANWLVLTEKTRLVSQVLDEVRARLEAFSKSKNYERLLQKLIVDAGTVLGGGNLEVQLNEKAARLSLDLSMLAESVTKKTSTRTQLKLSSENVKTAGGVVVKTADGKIIVDNTFEAILKRSERGLKQKIAKILFK